MGMNFTFEEGSALYGLLADSTTDIIIRTDDEGFIAHASPAIGQLGIEAASQLIAPHLFDLVHASWVPAVSREYAAAIRKRGSSAWVDFKARAPQGEEQWYAMKVQSLTGESGPASGALVVLRNINERKTLEAGIFAASFTDPLTGMTNRRAFTFMLRHLVDERAAGCLALFDIDHFGATNLKFGYASGDEVLIAFSHFLRKALRAQDIVSRLHSDRFAVLLPDVPPAEAKALADRAVNAFARVAKAPRVADVRLTARCGITPIGGTFDATMTRADRALRLAKATGGGASEVTPAPREALT